MHLVIVTNKLNVENKTYFLKTKTSIIKINELTRGGNQESLMQLH